MKIGIFGGTFDPPHTGHLILAAEAKDQLGLDRVLWVLTANPPHKRDRSISPLEDRLALVDAALEDNRAFELSRVDIDRPPPHYAIDTVRLLREEYPGDELIYLMGGDSLHDLPTWHDPQGFVAACDAIGVMRRPGFTFDLGALEAVLPGLNEKVCWIETPLIEISGSDIRRRVVEGRSFRYFVPDAVRECILDRRLYSGAG